MMKSGRAPDYRDRDIGRKPEARRLPAIPHRIESELDVCERGIETNLNAANQSLRVVGKYVTRVINGELWKRGDYLSFEDWCLKRWGWTRQRGYQMAEGSALLELLPADLSTVVVNERQARALVPVKESARPAVVKRAMKSGEPVTGKSITEAIKPKELKARKKKAESPKESKVIDVTPEPKKVPFVKHCATCTCTS